MRFIKGILKLIIFIVLFAIIVIGVFIFLITTENNEMPNEYLDVIEKDMTYNKYISNMNLIKGEKVLERDFNSIIYGTFKEFENDILSLNYGYIDISEKSIKTYFNITPKIEKLFLNKLNFEIKSEVSLEFKNGIVEIGILDAKISKLKIPKILMKKVITAFINEVDMKKIQKFDSEKMIIYLDFSDLFFKEIKLSEKAIEYKVNIDKELIVKTISEKLNMKDIKNINKEEMDKIVNELKEIPGDKQEKLLELLGEKLTEEELMQIKAALE